MATGAGLAEREQTHGKKKAKCVLTSTGLLMEGLREQVPYHGQDRPVDFDTCAREKL